MLGVKVDCEVLGELIRSAQNTIKLCSLDIGLSVLSESLSLFPLYNKVDCFSFKLFVDSVSDVCA